MCPFCLTAITLVPPWFACECGAVFGYNSKDKTWCATKQETIWPACFKEYNQVDREGDDD